MGDCRKDTRRKKKVLIDCSACSTQADCCRMGAWVDLEEAKKISALGLKGVFYHLEPDTDYPSGYRLGTSFGDEPCTFLDPDGLCSIHKIDYGIKPVACREFPYEEGSLSPFAKILCTLYKAGLRKSSPCSKPR